MFLAVVLANCAMVCGCSCHSPLPHAFAALALIAFLGCLSGAGLDCQAQGIVDAAIKNYGRLDILVNNSGVYEFAPIIAVTEEQFHKIFNINVLGAILTTQAAVKVEREIPGGQVQVQDSARGGWVNCSHA